MWVETYIYTDHFELATTWLINYATKYARMLTALAHGE